MKRPKFHKTPIPRSQTLSKRKPRPHFGEINMIYICLKIGKIVILYEAQKPVGALPTNPTNIDLSNSRVLQLFEHLVLPSWLQLCSLSIAYTWTESTAHALCWQPQWITATSCNCRATSAKRILQLAAARTIKQRGLRRQDNKSCCLTLLHHARDLSSQLTVRRKLGP